MPEALSLDLDLKIAKEKSKSASKKRMQPHFKGQEITSRTIKTPPWTYIHLSLIKLDLKELKFTSLDNLMARTFLSNALTQFLGLSGSAISVDFLKLENSNLKEGVVGEIWIRVPREDGSVVLAAVGGWVSGIGIGWKVLGWSNWLAGLAGDSNVETVWND